MARRRRYAGLISIMLAIFSIQLLFAPLPASRAALTLSSAPGAQNGLQNKVVEITPQMMEGLASNVEVIEDQYGIPHIFAKKAPDVFFMQGFFHARDRFFQMDALRRTAEGTLAELLGQSALGQDVQLRALNLTRDAEAIMKMLRPETRKFIKAYTNGVNEYLSKNPLPPEYQALKITQKRMWTEMDSVLIGKLFAFSQSFDTSFTDITNTLTLKAYQEAGKAKGFDGTALFFEDMYRSAPFDPAFTVPDAKGTPPTSADPNIRVNNDEDVKERLREMRQWAKAVDEIKPETLEMARKYIENFRGISTLLGGLVASQGRRNGSNWFVISGQHTESGSPMLTGDQHFDFATPPVWYQIQLNVAGKGKTAMNVIGVSIPGAPGVVLGHNDNVAWVATVTVFDVTDIYQEQIELGFNTISIVRADGKKFPVERRLPSFRLNQITDGKNDNIVDAPDGSVPTLFASVPFRNNGPIISLDAVSGTALSVQSAALGPTLEIEALVEMNRAKSIKEFQDAIQYLDGAHVNMAVAAANGDIAYFATGEIPLREDLDAGKVVGAPPFFIRDGRGGNDWLPLRKKQFRQALPTEMLPFEEMPQVINPKNGFIVNSNNDPAGTTAMNNPVGTKRANGGIYYLSAGYDFGARASRLRVEIQAAIDARKAGAKPIGIMDARRFQASVKMRDAEILLPFMLKAFQNAKRSGAPTQLAAMAADAGVSEALDRFSKWDFETPTGLRIGYDSFVPFNKSEPTDRQIDSSVATTIYSMWRSQFLRDVVDATLQPLGVTPSNGYEGEIAIASLRNLLDNFAARKGKGVSGIQFFNAPELAGASAEDQRDFIILRSLRRSLDALAGPDFALAFNGSPNQRDYRWGLLHRGYFPHLFGMTSSFSIPAAGARYDSPIPGLFGIPRDGGFEVPNACSHEARAKGVNDFMFVHGPSQRFTVVMKPGAIEAVNALPGGQSGVLGSKFRDNLLDFWLVCDVYPFISDKALLMQK